MNARGWYIQPQLAFDSSMENVHMSIAASNVEWVEPFLEDPGDRQLLDREALLSELTRTGP